MALVALLANPFSDIAALIDSFPALFDLDAAVGVQLDATGAWIGLARQVSGILVPGFFGFSDDTSALGFGELTDPSVGGRFFELSDSAGGSAILADPEYRQILRAKILQNQWDGSVAQFEAALLDILGPPGPASFVSAAYPALTFDPGTKVVTIIPTAIPDPVVYALLTQHDLVPRAAGVRYQYLLPISGPTWSFFGTANVLGNGQPASQTSQSVTKTSGVNAWDSSAYIGSPSTKAYLGWVVPSVTSTQFFGGLSANPSGSAAVGNLDYGLLCIGGTIQIWEKGVQVTGPFGSYAASDSFAVYCDGVNVVYLHNLKVLRVTPQLPFNLQPEFLLNNVLATPLATNIIAATG